jgi:uncharacterized RDD family membrane protein YckC
VFLLYHPVAEVLTQRTLGKKLLGLEVVTSTGRRPSLGAIIVRHLSRPLIGGLLWYFAFGTFRVHDLFSSTQVVHPQERTPAKS